MNGPVLRTAQVRTQSAARPLTRNLPACEAARRLFYQHYQILLLNWEGTVRPPDSNPLHDLRIAIRRMRMILRTFRKPLAETSAERVNSDLRRLNRALGAARDLDVWIGFLTSAPVKAELGGHRLWGKFVAHQQELRRMQQVTVRRHLKGAGFAAFRKRVERFLEVELPGATGAEAAAPVEEVARRVIGKNLHRAFKCGHLRHSDNSEKLHRLRIALRRLRYIIAFFQDVVEEPVLKLGKRVHAVERSIGDMRDADLALERILSEGPVPPRVLVRRLMRQRASKATELDSTWRRLRDPRLMADVVEALKE